MQIQVHGGCKEWDILGSDNEVWFYLSMNAFFEPHARPLLMDKKDKKLNWKLQFLKLTSPQPSFLLKPKRVKKKTRFYPYTPHKR